MNRRRAAWEYLDADLKPDVGLLQECAPTRERERVVYRHGGIGEGRNWGSAVVSGGLPLHELTEAKSRYSRRPANLIRFYPGSTAIGAVALPEGPPLIAVSMYGLIEDGYAHTTVHRLLSDLTALFDSSLAERLVLGGDLNVSTQLQPPSDGRSRNVFDRLEGLGLVDLLALTRDRRPVLTNCPCRDEPCTHVQTQRHVSSQKPWQNDYLYGSRKLAERLVDCHAVDSGDPDPWSFSDHCPVVATFEL